MKVCLDMPHPFLAKVPHVEAGDTVTVNVNHPPSPGGNASAVPTDDALSGNRSSSNSRSGLDPVASALTNPLSTGQSKFMTSAEGRECESILVNLPRLV